MNKFQPSALSVLGFILGLIATPLLLSLIPNHHFVRAPKSLSEIKNYQAYNLAHIDKDKYFIVGNCNMIHDSVGNDYEHGDKEVYHTAANYSEVANFILDRQKLDHVRFFDFGHGGSTYAEHLIYIYHALALPHAKAIIFSNAFFTQLYMKRPGEVLEAIYTLEKIEHEFPSAGKDARILIQYYTNTAQYQDEVRSFGSDWRDHISQSTLSLSKDHYAFLFLKDFSAFKLLKNPIKNGLLSPSGFKNFWADVREDELVRFYIRKFFNPGYSVEEMLLTKFSLFTGDENHTWENLVETKLDWVAAQYNHSHANPPITGLYELKAVNQLEDSEGPARIAFFRMVAKMAKSKGVPFIYYLLPRLDMRNEFYTRLYKPTFLNKLDSLAQEESFQIINQTNDHDLSPLDYMTTLGNNGEDKSPILVNIVGNFKRARLLINELSSRGLLSLTNKFTESQVWPNWQSLPKVDVPVVIRNAGKVDQQDISSTQQN